MSQRFGSGGVRVGGAVLGAALVIVVVGCEGIGGVTGNCSGDGPSNRQVRVHVDNGNNNDGVKVTLTAGGQVCVIDELIVDSSNDNEDNEFDQVVMGVEQGTPISVLAERGGARGSRSCTVSADAFSGSGRGEAFMTVFSAPPSVQCLAGF